MISLVLAGRTDVEDYFDCSGMCDADRMANTPSIVSIIRDDEVVVEIVDSPVTLLTHPDDTPVMRQWVTDETSDFFHFTVGQYKRHREQRDSRLRSSRNVVKVIGPRGGFRSLAYEYTDEHGVTVHVTIVIRDEAERLEAQFQNLDIPIKVERSAPPSTARQKQKE